MSFSQSTNASESEVKVWQEAYQETLRTMGGPAWRQSKNPAYHEASVNTFCEFATAWLKMLDQDGRHENPQQRKYFLYLILWGAKDIAHPYVEKAWERLSAEWNDDSEGGLKATLHAELTSIVHADVANDAPGATAFADLCKQVDVKSPTT